MQLAPVGDLSSPLQRFHPKLIFFVPKSYEVISTVKITNVKCLWWRIFLLLSNLWFCKS